MTPYERRSVFSLALLYSTRMLGLFMILPVFMVYGQSLHGASELLLGVAVGAYGLSQALFQIPFGALSDRFGRKKLITIGLLLFFVGSIVAAGSESIYGVIFGRFLQGAGAIASVLMALLSDLTSEESRTKGMALIGVSIGISFSLALIIGPVIGQWFGLEGIFLLTAGLALFALLWLHLFVPTPVNRYAHRDTRLFKSQLQSVLANKELQRLDIGIFALHLGLTAIFVSVPISLVKFAGVPIDDHWLVYLSVMVLSFFAMVPFIIVGEKKQKMRPIFLLAIVLLASAAFSMSWTQSDLHWFWCSLFLFFMAFNLLEASLPSLVSKLAPAASKGTAMGVYSTSQFLGAFVGGVLGGWVLGRYHEQGVYILVGGTLFCWLLIAYGMKNPNPETALAIRFKRIADEQEAFKLSEALAAVKGVEEAVVIEEDNIAHLKVIKGQLDEPGLQSIRQRFGAITS